MIKGIACFQGKPLVIFTSEDSHYSVLKAANWMGIGTDNVVKVKTDPAGRMMPNELRKAIQTAMDNNKVPLAGKQDILCNKIEKNFTYSRVWHKHIGKFTNSGVVFGTFIQ